MKYKLIFLSLLLFTPSLLTAGNLSASADNSTVYNDRDLNTRIDGSSSTNFYLTWGRREFVIDSITFKHEPSVVGNYRSRIARVKVEFGGSSRPGNPASPLFLDIGYSNTGQWVVTKTLPKGIFLTWIRITPVAWYPHQRLSSTTTWNGDSTKEATTFYQINELELGGTLPTRYQVQKSLRWLGKTAIKWTRGTGTAAESCNGCHVQAQAVTGLSEGFNNNYDVDFDSDSPNEDPSISDFEDLAFFTIRCQNPTTGYLGHPCAEVPYGRDNNISIEQDGVVSRVNPFQTPENGLSYYDFTSWSAHKWCTAYESHILLHKDTRNNNYSFIFTHNVDGSNYTDNKLYNNPWTGASGLTSDNRVVTNTSISGINTQLGSVEFGIDWGGTAATIAASDDPGEVPTGQTGTAYWRFGDNTDGGVIDIGQATNLNIKITPLSWDKWRGASGIMNNKGAANKWRLIGANPAGGPYHGDYTKNPIPPTTISLKRDKPITIKGGVYPYGEYFHPSTGAAWVRTSGGKLVGWTNTSYPRTTSMFAAMAIIPFAEYYVSKRAGKMKKGTKAEVDTFLRKLGDYALTIQEASGAWAQDHATFGAGPFSSDSDRARHTAVYSHLLVWLINDGLYTGSKKTAATNAIGKATTWLGNFTPQTTQDASFAVLGLIWSGGELAKLDIQIKRLIALRRPSRAAWGINASAAVDPYSTGMATYALKKAGFNMDQSIDPSGANPGDYQFQDALDDLFAQQDTAGEMNDGYWALTGHTNLAGTMFAATSLGTSVSLTDVDWKVPGLPQGDITYSEVNIADRSDTTPNLDLQVDVLSNTGDLVQKVEFYAQRLGMINQPKLIGVCYSPAAPKDSPSTTNDSVCNTDGNARTYEIKYNARDLPDMTTLANGNPKGGTYKFYAKAYTDFPSVDESTKTANIGVSEITLPTGFTWSINEYPRDKSLTPVLNEEQGYGTRGIRGTQRHIVDSYKIYYEITREDESNNPEIFRNYSLSPIRLDPAANWSKYYSDDISFNFPDGGEYWVRMIYQYSIASTGQTIKLKIPTTSSKPRGYKFHVKQKTPINGSSYLIASLNNKGKEAKSAVLPINEDSSSLSGTSYKDLAVEVFIKALAFADRPGFNSQFADYGVLDVDITNSVADVSGGVLLFDQSTKKWANDRLLSTIWNSDVGLEVEWNIYRGDIHTESGLTTADKFSGYKGIYNLKVKDVALAAGLDAIANPALKIIDLLKKENISINIGANFAGGKRCSALTFGRYFSDKVPNGLRTPLEKDATKYPYYADVTFRFETRRFDLSPDATRYTMTTNSYSQNYTNPGTGVAGDYRRSLFVKDTHEYKLVGFNPSSIPSARTGDPFPGGGATNPGHFRVKWSLSDNNPYMALVEKDSILSWKMCRGVYSTAANGNEPIPMNVTFTDTASSNQSPSWLKEKTASWESAGGANPPLTVLKTDHDDMWTHKFQRDIPFFSNTSGIVPTWLKPGTTFTLSAKSHYRDSGSRKDDDGTPKIEFSTIDNDPPALKLKIANMRGQVYRFEVNEEGACSVANFPVGSQPTSPTPVNDPDPYNDQYNPFLLKATYQNGSSAVENLLNKPLWKKMLFNTRPINYVHSAGILPYLPAEHNLIDIEFGKATSAGAYSPIVQLREDDRIHLELILSDNDALADYRVDIFRGNKGVVTAQFPKNEGTTLLDPLAGKDSGLNRNIETRQAYMVFPEPFSLTHSDANHQQIGRIVVEVTDASGNKTRVTIPFEVLDTKLEIRVLESQRNSNIQ